VEWTDYIPLGDKQVVVIGFEKGKIRYVDVSERNPFDTAMYVMKCMEDVCFDAQFMTEFQLSPYVKEIYQLFMRRDDAYNYISSCIKERKVTCSEIVEIVTWGQENGYFPEFVADIKDNELLMSGTFESLLKSRDVTTYDTLQFERKLKDVVDKKNNTEK
jgi:hypothetical protein